MLLERARSQLLVVDVQERLAPAIDGIEGVERNCRILLEAAHKLAVPVMISEQYPHGLGHTLPSLLPHAGGNQVFEKLEFSCFANHALRTALTEHGNRETVICGTEAHVCVLQTALEMKGAGHEVVIVADAVSSRSLANRALALDRAARAGIEIVSTEMVLFEWLRSAADPAFRAVSTLIR
ncbi:isochorismatase family protein [Dongia sp.]|uniref:isochorismatase family protein n=1 Tax=Dongia sp. TaxID=1977262 RepID=UPI0035B1869D